MSDWLKNRRLNRRRLLKNISAAFGAASSLPGFAGLSAETVFAQGQSIHKHLSENGNSVPAQGQLFVFNGQQSATVEALCELIIPETATPGAKAARVHEFIDTYLSSVSSSKRQEFMEGLHWIDQRSQELFSKSFVSATPHQQTELLTRLSVPHSLESPDGQAFFRQIKNLTVFGYYTSKIGIEQELNFKGWVEYQGCTHDEHQT
jgi:hypothetical protein